MLTTRSIAKAFLRGIRQSKVATTGAIIVTILFPVLVIYAVLEAMAVIDNPQTGFIVYGALTWMFILGHIMVFVGLFLLRNKKAPPLFSASDFKGLIKESTRFNSVRKLILFVSFITFFNFMVIGVTAYNGYHYSESVSFCAKLCHGVMIPEFTAYQNSPHSRVACVECHIGSGAKWFVKSKLSGARQLVAVSLNSYAKPIATPIHGLRPARETCEECHRPELFHGNNLKVKDKFLDDEMNTHVQTILLMKVGTGNYRGHKAEGIHGHVSKSRKIMFEYADLKRETIGDVILIKEDGSEIAFTAGSVEPDAGSHEGGRKAMDCLDCHNRPTHIYLSQEEALDQKLLNGEIPRDLPYIKKQAMEIISQEYRSHEEAEKKISEHLAYWYNKNYPKLTERNPSMLENAITGVTQTYTENVFPDMHIGFGTYRSYLGHRGESGCFRCHDDSHENENGETISQDCDTCHLILAEEEPASSLRLSEGSASNLLNMLQDGQSL